MAKVLLQTTIEYAENDWNIGRFSLLAEALRSEGHDVETRDRKPTKAGDDPVLSGLTHSQFDQVWLFGADCGMGLSLGDVRGVNSFRASGGGLLTARDHQDLGGCLTDIDNLGEANYFHSKSPEPDPRRRVADDTNTPNILWPNYHSGANGDFQMIQIVGDIHPLLRHQDRSVITYFPAHPHEGAIGAEHCGARGRVIAKGISKVTDRLFNLIVALDPEGRHGGRGIVHSSFHHFADCNWDPRLPSPSFVTELPGDGMLRNQRAAADIRDYVRNAANWLNGGDK